MNQYHFENGNMLLDVGGRLHPHGHHKNHHHATAHKKYIGGNLVKTQHEKQQDKHKLIGLHKKYINL